MFIEPVFGKKFFGREEILGTLQKRVTALKGGYRQNLALTGPMLAGKSSILRHFLKNLKDPDIIPLYIEMGEDDFHVFCTRFMATLLYRYLISMGQDASEDFEELKQECYSRIPKTLRYIDAICKDLKQRKENRAYEKLLAVTSVFKVETGKSCIVILDEFHNLSNFRLKNPFRVFGKFIMVQKNTMYIVSSSQKTLLQEILSKKLSLLFGNFEVIDVDGFDNQTARSFVSDKIGKTGLSENIKNYVIQVTHGNPFYLEAFMNRISGIEKERNNKLNIIECFLAAFSELLYESDGVLNQYFTNNINFFLEKKARKQFVSVLLSMSRGNSTIKTIQKYLGRTDKELGTKLQKLQDMDLVYSSGVFYKITDKLFEYWLKYVYSLKSQSIIDDMDIRYLEFKRCVEDDYKKYCESASRDLRATVSDLFKSFENKKIQVGMNCRKMPKFDAVRDSVVSKNVFRITGKIQNKKWLCHVKHDDITYEQDIWDLSGIKAGDKQSKIVRKIFISLNGIEQNAFLLAKEKNIWVWDVRQLNKILRLFGKFELVL